MRQIHAIINPAAGGGRCGREWPAIARQIRDAGMIMSEHLTTRRGEAAKFARQAILHNAAEVLIVGGDGTINEIVNALADPVHHHVKAIVSLMPLGSGSDFARNLGTHSVREAMEALANEQVILVDLGHLSFATETGRASRIFVNSADLGLGARVANRVNRSRKRLGGTIAYLVAAMREIATAKPFDVQVNLDGEPIHSGAALMALIVNGRCYGGGMVAAPTASVDDGLLDLIILKQTSRVNLMFSLLPRVYRGAHIGHPAVIAARGKRMELECDQSTPMALDGEVTSVQSAIITVIPRALRVRVPPGSDSINSPSRR